MDRCLICHRKLTDKESKERGMGPTCWRRVMKVVKEDKERKMARRASVRRISGEIDGQINLFDDQIVQNEDVIMDNNILKTKTAKER